MPRLLVIIATLGSVACLPPAEDAGEVDATESDGGATERGSAGDTDDAPPAEASLEWSLELEPDLSILHMIRTPQGVLVALGSDPGAVERYAEVREYSSTMDLLWSAQLPNATIDDLEILGGGEFLAVGGSWGESSTLVPTAWRLSCCAAPSSQSYPQDTDYARIFAAELRGDGILLVIRRSDAGLDVAEVVQVPLALSPPTRVDLLPTSIYDAARMADGNVLLRGDGELASMTCFFEVGPEGVGESFGYGGTLYGMVGKGDELTLMGLGEDEVAIQPFGEDAWVNVPIPGFTAYDGGFVLDRHARVALVHGEGDSVGPSSLYLTEFGDDGVVARTLTIPHLQYEHVDAHAIAAGEDDAIYLAVGESEAGVGAVEYLHRIAAL